MDDEELAPSEVIQKLQEDLIKWKASNNLPLLTSHVNDYLLERETVLFCAPPHFANGIDIPFKLYAIASHVVAVHLGMAIAQVTNHILAIFLLSTVALWAVQIYLVVLFTKWKFFGYRIATNYRATIVIPRHVKYLVPSGVLSSFYKPALSLMSRNALCVRNAECLFPDTRSFFAEIRYGMRNEDVSEFGTVMVNGPRMLEFGLIQDADLLEEVLVNSIKEAAANTSNTRKCELRVESVEKVTTCIIMGDIFRAVFLIGIIFLLCSLIVVHVAPHATRLEMYVWFIDLILCSSISIGLCVKKPYCFQQVIVGKLM